MKNCKIGFPQNSKDRCITRIKVPLPIFLQQDNFYFIRFLKLEKRNVLLNQNCIISTQKDVILAQKFLFCIIEMIQNILFAMLEPKSRDHFHSV